MTGLTKWLAGSIGCAMALSAISDAWAQYYTGTDRASFVAGAANSCIRGYGSGDTSVIPKPLFERYCQCYANGLADRAPMSDLKANNPAVMRPIIQAEGRRCYDEIKAESMRIAGPAAAARLVKDGLAAYQRDDYETALRLIRPPAEQGNADAQFGLGVMYSKGHGVPQDYAAAASWFRKAADQGDAVAQSNLGMMYANGQGVRQDYAAAVSWYRKAADQGDTAAQLNLGGMYANGQGVTEPVETRRPAS
jgi:hypothetical protein